jgi:histidine triad (HIT) family protein
VARQIAGAHACGIEYQVHTGERAALSSTVRFAMTASNSDSCVFCAIVRGEAQASIVYEDSLIIAFVDLRQFHPGHMLVIPRAHLADVRELDAATGAALMAAVAKVTEAVGDSFPNEGLSLWHSIGPAAFQEVPHLHVHVHPRRTGDGLLKVYPGEIQTADAESRQRFAERVRYALGRADA